MARGQVVRRGVVDSAADLVRALTSSTVEPARVAIEACREAWFAHDLLKAQGHEVLLVDTTRAKELGIGLHRRKNDRIDAEVLARGVERDIIPRAHVLSVHRRELRSLLSARAMLVKARAQQVAEIRHHCRAAGVRLSSCKVENFEKHLVRESLPDAVRAISDALMTTIRALTPQIEQLEKRLELVAAQEPVVRLLMTTPGVGPVVATSFVSVIDAPNRFRSAHQVEAYVGLVPSENTSGTRRLGGITKHGNRYLRAMLVQAAWGILRTKQTGPLKLWALNVALKRGRKIAAVALARRLSGILWAMWRDSQPFRSNLVAETSSSGLRTQVAHLEVVADKISAAST